MKEGIRAVGIDDGPLSDRTLLVGVVMRRDRFEGLVSTRVTRDGTDATEKILSMLSGRFSKQIHVVFLDGIAVAGFNLVDYVELSRELGVPVIAVTENEPHPDEFEVAVSRWKDRLNLWNRIKQPPFRAGKVWFQFAGTSEREARELIQHFTVHSKVPEPLRIAHMIAAGIELGESKGL